MVDEVRHRGKAPPFSFPGKGAEAAAAVNAKEQQHKLTREKKSGANSNDPQPDRRRASSMPAATAGQSRGKKVSALM